MAQYRSIYAGKDKDKNLLMADNGGGTVTPEAVAESKAKLDAQHAAQAPAAQAPAAQVPAAPSYNYVPSTFGYNYGYAPTRFTEQYGYTPTKFEGQYGYAPEQFSYEGQQYTPTKFSYENGNQYTPNRFSYESQYAGLIRAAEDKLLNWNYDPDQDVSYNAYKNQYTRAGQQAMTDAMAKNAARTGGMGSSYAVTAAQQAYNNYMAQLAAKVPELERLAYSRASDQLSYLTDAEKEAYRRAFNEYADWEDRQRIAAESDYSKAFNEYQDWENRQRAAAETSYNNAFNEYADWQNRQRVAADTAYNNAFNEYSDWENRQRVAADTAYENAWANYQDWENRQRVAADTAYDIAYKSWVTQENAREQAAKNAYNNAVNQYNAKYGSSSSGSSGDGHSANYDLILKNVKDQKDPIGYLDAQLRSGALQDWEYDDIVGLYYPNEYEEKRSGTDPASIKAAEDAAKKQAEDQAAAKKARDSELSSYRSGAKTYKGKEDQTRYFLGLLGRNEINEGEFKTFLTEFGLNDEYKQLVQHANPSFQGFK